MTISKNYAILFIEKERGNIIMGLDQYLVLAHNKHEVESENFWNGLPDYSYQLHNEEEFEYDKPAIVWYNRKNWDLHHHIARELDNSEWKQMDKEDLEDMLDFLTHNPDYFGDFNTVPELCRVIYNYDKIRANGLTLFYEGDY